MQMQSRAATFGIKQDNDEVAIFIKMIGMLMLALNCHFIQKYTTNHADQCAETTCMRLRDFSTLQCMAGYNYSKRVNDIK